MKTGKMLTTGVAAVCMACFASFPASDASGASAYVVVDLTPSYLLNPGDSCWGSGISDSQQVGNSNAGPLLWSGTAASCVNLNSSLIEGLMVQGVGGNQQVGYAFVEGYGRAYLWTGTAASRVDLTPSSLQASYAFGTNGTQQAGYGYGTPTDNNFHALLWNGTAEDYVDLNPSGFMGSVAVGISGTQQVGWGQGTATEGYNHAVLWNGTAASCVVLHPDGFLESYANGINGTQQVGYGSLTDTGDSDHALLWNGTAESCVDLNQFLPSGWTSEAYGINSKGDVIGEALDDSGIQHAILWKAALPGDANLDGPVSFADYQILEANFGTMTGMTWGQGDFNGDHAVTFADYQMLEAHFGKSIPEPATLSLLALGGLALIRRWK